MRRMDHPFARPTVMFRFLQRLFPLAALVAAVGLLAGCDTEPGPGLYDPSFEGLPTPVISSVEPAGGGLAGVSTLTINGQNFAASPADNLVFFDGTKVTVTAASPTRLEVRAPNLPRPGLKVKVAVVGALDFSNVVTYDLAPAVENFAAVQDFEDVYGVASDDEGNLYISLFENNASAGIKKVSPAGTRSDYISSSFKWDDLAMDAEGYLYGVRSVRALFRFPPGGGAQETWAVIPNNAARFQALAIDDAGNVWAGGTGGEIYRVTPDKQITGSPVDGAVRAIRVQGGQLYAAVTKEGVSNVLRFPIQADGTLGTPEVFLAVSSVYGAAEARAIALAADGTLFVGTDKKDPILVAEAPGSWSVLYPGLMQPIVTGFAWGESPHLYMVRGRSTNSVTGVTTPPRITRINTQREAP